MYTRVKFYLMGSKHVGITAIFSQIILGEFEQRYDPYLIDPRTIVTINKENVVLEVNHPLMDEYVAIQHHHIRSSDILFVIYSVTDRSSFEDVPSIVENIRNLRGDGNSCPIILIGNKIDLEDQREVSEDEGRNLARDLKIRFVETSATDGSNIQQLFIQSATEFIQRPAAEPSVVQESQNRKCSVM